MSQFLKSKLENFSLNLKMASTSGSGHSGKQINSGQKRIFENIGKEKGRSEPVVPMRIPDSVPLKTVSL